MFSFAIYISISKIGSFLLPCLLAVSSSMTIDFGITELATSLKIAAVCASWSQSVGRGVDWGVVERWRFPFP